MATIDLLAVGGFGDEAVVPSGEEVFEDVAVGLLDFIEEDDSVGVVAQAGGECAVAGRADIAARHAEELRRAEGAGGILSHVEVQQFALHGFRQHFGEEGFAGAGRTGEEENADRAIALGHGQTTAQLLGEILTDLRLTDDFSLQILAEFVCVQQDGLFIEPLCGFFDVIKVAESVEYVHGNEPVNPVGSVTTPVPPCRPHDANHDEEQCQQVAACRVQESTQGRPGTGKKLPQHDAHAGKHQDGQETVDDVHGGRLLQVEVDALSFRQYRQGNRHPATSKAESNAATAIVNPGDGDGAAGDGGKSEGLRRMHEVDLLAVAGARHHDDITILRHVVPQGEFD